jgi:hypothetical protein
VFWPDLDRLEELKVENVTKEENPPIGPQLQPIEKFLQQVLFEKRKMFDGKDQKRANVH